SAGHAAAGRDCGLGRLCRSGAHDAGYDGGYRGYACIAAPGPSRGGFRSRRGLSASSILALEDRMLRIFAALALFIALISPASAQTTQWRVKSAEGLDALLLLGAASGDVMQGEIYPGEIAWVRSHFSPRARAALNSLDRAMRVEGGQLTG